MRSTINPLTGETRPSGLGIVRLSLPRGFARKQSVQLGNYFNITPWDQKNSSEANLWPYRKLVLNFGKTYTTEHGCLSFNKKLHHAIRP